MNYFKYLAILLPLLFQHLSAQNTDKNYSMTSFKDKGTLAPKEHFTGTVYVNMNVTADDIYNSVVGTVTFEPKARTNWHSHDTGQILMVTKGIGYYQEVGKPIITIKEGDVIKIASKVKHWHGGSHYSQMQHIAIVTQLDQGETIWNQPVTDTEYNSYEAPVEHVDNALSPAAIQNHEALWPNFTFDLKHTDPELIEIFDNFAFDQTYSNSDLDIKTRVLTTLASSIASQGLTQYKLFVDAALQIGITPQEIKEVVYQAVPYVGMAKVVDFVYATNDLFKQHNITLPLEPQATVTEANREEKGLELMKATFGERISQNRANAPADQKHFQEFLATNCFGDYYTRKGFDMKTRELLTFSMLISMGGTTSQVKGHIQGNLNVGNNRNVLVGVVTQLVPYIGYPRSLNALGDINEVTAEN